MRSQRLRIPNGRGQVLAGRLDLPISGRPRAYALYAHCFTCSKDMRAIGRISATLAHHGVATLRFDFTGLGESEGDFADTNFSTSVDDFRAAAEFLAEDYVAPEILIGHSLGGSVVLRATGSIPSARAVVTIAAPAAPGHLTNHLAHDLERIEQEGRAEVMLSGRPFEVKQQLIDDIEQQDLASDLAALDRPLLVIHPAEDRIVPVENAMEIIEHARHPKSFVSLDGADHLIGDDADARFVAELLASWADRYVSESLLAHSQADLSVEDPENVTVVRVEDGLRADVLSNGFPLVADEPEDVGGTNTGPTPYDYLLTSLGACTAMTLRMYADRKEWPLDSVTVRLSHSKVHARDCAACESDGGFIDHIDREITIRGELDADQRSRMLEIADRCPVHKTLHGEVVIRSEGAGAG